MFNRLSNAPNRSILYDLYNYICDIKSGVSLARAYVKTLGEKIRIFSWWWKPHRLNVKDAGSKLQSTSIWYCCRSYRVAFPCQPCPSSTIELSVGWICAYQQCFCWARLIILLIFDDTRNKPESVKVNWLSFQMWCFFASHRRAVSTVSPANGRWSWTLAVQRRPLWRVPGKCLLCDTCF